MVTGGVAVNDIIFGVGIPHVPVIGCDDDVVGSHCGGSLRTSPEARNRTWRTPICGGAEFVMSVTIITIPTHGGPSKGG